MEILVCIKPVPEPDARLRVGPDGTSFEAEGVKFVLAGYDESAVEQALLLREAVPGSKVHALSMGPAPRTEEVLRAALALGCETATWIETPHDAVVDSLLVARGLALAAKRKPFDLVLCGKQAGDTEAGIVASALGEFLGTPDFGCVLDLRWNATSSHLTFQRATESGTENWEAPLPCVIGLQQAWNDPRTAKLPNILKSRKAPIERLAWGELAAGSEGTRAARSRPTKFQLPPPRTGAKMIEYKTPEEAAVKLVRILREEAKVFP
jgi:electron transfer flavoprotein beta subunit